jgi:sugar phosphate isomerase/epimerase
LNGENFKETIETITRLGNVPFHIHIDDNYGDADAHLIPGEGEIDFSSLARVLKAINYQGFISAELGFQYAGDPDSAVQKTYHWLVENFGK